MLKYRDFQEFFSFSTSLWACSFWLPDVHGAGPSLVS